MDGFLNILKQITGIGSNNVQKPSGNNKGIIDTLKRVAPIFGGTPIEDAGEQTPLIPKAPSFTYTDPVFEWLKKQDMYEDAKMDLWYRYQNKVNALDDPGKNELRRKLRSDDFLDSYMNSLMEEGYREWEDMIRYNPYTAEDYLRDFKRTNQGIGEERIA